MAYKVRILPPAAEFLDALPDRFRAKAVREITLLQEFGPFLREPHAKKVTGWQGLFELRVALGTDACRFFYFWDGEQIAVIASGYVKKGMKLERRELERAVRLMKAYRENEGAGR
jgi:mRNA-degrading endonuclease RelE of RelBE toxin-antitoxin system